jgi:uncharacterized protein involved in type VI secretion and phage assembly
MNLLELLAADAGATPHRERIYGAVVGVVTSVSDPEDLGRVKLKFPWLAADIESHWARPVTFLAGADCGAVFRPEVGAEVLVVFEQGDTRFPYVLGGLWNGKEKPPSAADSNVRLIRSRSGHTIVLDDTSGKEKVTVTDKSGNRVELSSDGILVDSKAIKLGSSGASESLVLGDALLNLFNSHTHGTGVGPSSPPTQPMVKGQHISSKHKAE